jgi:hypothetical protein
MKQTGDEIWKQLIEDLSKETPENKKALADELRDRFLPKLPKTDGSWIN